LFGYSKNEISGRNVVGTIVPRSESTGRDLAAIMGDIGRYPEHYKSHVNENLCKNGERVWIDWTNKAIQDENGNVVEILSVGNDITVHKRIEEALRESEEMFRSLAESAKAGIILTRGEEELLATILNVVHLYLRRVFTTILSTVRDLYGE
jgi:PAS domain S-box-containing protein